MSAAAVRSRKRTIALWALAGGLLYVVVELVALAGLVGLQIVRPKLFVHGFVDVHFNDIDEAFRSQFIDGGFYDPILGWDNAPLTEHKWQNTAGQPYTVSHDADGSRADGLPTKALLMSTYGDSFTWGDEVENDETWQYFLESSLGYEVKNYGVGAYGTDQALLKLEQHVAEGMIAPITVLAILDENINRVMTSFRPLYDEHSSLRLGFKPAFRLSDSNRIELQPNPYDDPALLLDELRGMAHALAPTDYWSRQSGRVEIRFPYLLQLTRAVMSIARRKWRDWRGESPSQATTVDLWQSELGRSIMHHIVRRFVQDMEAVGSIPVVLFLPTGPTVMSGSSPHAEFAAEVAARFPDAYVVDVAEETFDRERFNVRPYGGHTSPYGNRVIAAALERVYRDIQSQQPVTPTPLLP